MYKVPGMEEGSPWVVVVGEVVVEACYYNTGVGLVGAPLGWLGLHGDLVVGCDQGVLGLQGQVRLETVLGLWLQ